MDIGYVKKKKKKVFVKEQVETPRGSSKSFFTAATINFYIEFELFLRVNLTSDTFFFLFYYLEV